MGIFDCFKSREEKIRERNEQWEKEERAKREAEYWAQVGECAALNARGNGRYEIRYFSYDNGLIQESEIVKVKD